MTPNEFWAFFETEEPDFMDRDRLKELMEKYPDEPA